MLGLLDLWSIQKNGGNATKLAATIIKPMCGLAISHTLAWSIAPSVCDAARAKYGGAPHFLAKIYTGIPNHRVYAEHQ